MKRFGITLASALLAVGCASQSSPRLGSVEPANIPNSAAAETLLNNVRLHDAAILAITPAVASRIADDMRFRAGEAGDADAGVTSRLTTIGAVKKQQLFTNSYLSDDTQVVLATSEGRFEVPSAADAAAPKHAFGRMAGIFDPKTGETLGMGFVP